MTVSGDGLDPVHPDRVARAEESAAVAAAALNETAAGIRADNRRHNQTVRLLVLSGVASLAVVAVGLVVVGVLVSRIADLTGETRRLESARLALSQQNQKILNEIESCTTEGGKCKADGDKRTGAVIAQLNLGALKASIAVNRCGAVSTTVDEYDACTAKLLPKP